jgi:heptosyltransferase-2
MLKILVARYRFIGDTILTVPFLRNLRKAYPDAQIDMLAGPMSGELLEECPYIDNLIYFDTTRKHKYENTGEKRKTFFSYVKLLKRTNYDRAYVLKRSFSSALLVYLAGIKHRIGFDTENRGFLLTKKVPYIKDRHEVECFLDVLRAEGIDPEDSYLENWINPATAEKIDGLLNWRDFENKPKVLIHATSGNINKQWADEYFAKVIEFLSNEKNAQVFYTGTASDQQVYDRIHALIKTELKNKPLSFCGKLSLVESSALISRMDLAIGSDSGNLHIAASFNVPVIGIYGPMNHKKWHAWGDRHVCMVDDLECIPCELKKPCKYNRACLYNITPEKVVGEIEKLLNTP